VLVVEGAAALVPPSLLALRESTLLIGSLKRIFRRPVNNIPQPLLLGLRACGREWACSAEQALQSRTNENGRHRARSESPTTSTAAAVMANAIYNAVHSPGKRLEQRRRAPSPPSACRMDSTARHTRVRSANRVRCPVQRRLMLTVKSHQGWALAAICPSI